MASPLAGSLSMSLGTSTRSILRDSAFRDSGFNGKSTPGVAGNLKMNSSTLWTRTSWNDGGCGVRGNSALDAYSRGVGSKRTPAYLFARDRVVDFGKNKGSMLGTLSSRYGVLLRGLSAFEKIEVDLRLLVLPGTFALGESVRCLI